MPHSPDPTDSVELTTALEALIEALEANTARNAVAIRRATSLIDGLRAGTTNTEMVTENDEPLILELTRENLAALNDAGSRVRRAQVLALHREGMSTYAIASIIGVTRQRVSQIIKAARLERSARPSSEGGTDHVDDS